MLEVHDGKVRKVLTEEAPWEALSEAPAVVWEVLVDQSRTVPMVEAWRLDAAAVGDKTFIIRLTDSNMNKEQSQTILTTDS